MKYVGPNLAFGSGYGAAGPSNLLGMHRVAASGALLPYAANWYRLLTVSTDNNGYYNEFLFIIHGRHVMMKVTFAKTTASGNYGAGILKVELLGSYGYGHAHPYKWRVVDNGTNGTTSVDIQFPNADGTSTLNYFILQIAAAQFGSQMSFPLTSQGPGAGGGTFRNYGISMGSGSAENWTMQQFTLNATNGAYEVLSNDFTRSTGTATAM